MFGPSRTPGRLDGGLLGPVLAEEAALTLDAPHALVAKYPVVHPLSHATSVLDPDRAFSIANQTPYRTIVLKRERESKLSRVEQLSLLELDRLEEPGITDEHHVVRLAQRIVDENGLAPPIDHRVVASYQGIAQIELRESDEWAGCLVKEPRGLIVYLRASDGRRRQRYTTCHEVGHTFLPGFAVQTQFRCAPSLAGTRPGEERLSNVAASELLFPRRFFCADLEGVPFGLDTIDALADAYDASIEATAHRFAALWPEDCLLVVLEPMRKPADQYDPEATERLRVVYSSRYGSWPFVPHYKSAAEGSRLASALEGEVVQAKGEDLDGLTAEPVGQLELSARLMPYHDGEGQEHRRVIALYRRLSSRALASVK